MSGTGGIKREGQTEKTKELEGRRKTERKRPREKGEKKNLETGPHRVEGTPINMKTTTTVPVMPGTGWS